MIQIKTFYADEMIAEMDKRNEKYIIQTVAVKRGGFEGDSFVDWGFLIQLSREDKSLESFLKAEKVKYEKSMTKREYFVNANVNNLSREKLQAKVLAAVNSYVSP